MAKKDWNRPKFRSDGKKKVHWSEQDDMKHEKAVEKFLKEKLKSMTVKKGQND